MDEIGARISLEPWAGSWGSYFELHKALVTSENKEHRRYHDIEALEIGFFVGNDL